MPETDSQTVARALGELVEWGAAVSWPEVPDAIGRHAALILLDDFAAMAAARNEPELIALRDGVARSAGPAEATVFDGGQRRLDRYSAALSNGAAADWCELDGGYRPAVCHAALYCLPALLAEAEATGASLREVLLALLVGYETVARFARAFVFPRLVLHPHGGLATIGAAAAVARLRGQSAGVMGATLSAAATLVLPGPFSHAVKGALVRNVWPGLCAQNGLRAADWAAIGIAGTPDSVSDVFVSIFGAAPRAAELSTGLGRDWAVDDGYHKMHACCQYGHSTVEAVLAALAGGGGIDPAAIEAIRVETHEKGQVLDNAAPATTLAAKFSIQHIAAATAAFGHAGAQAFHADTLGDAGLARLRHRVTIDAYAPRMDWPNDRPARVALTLGDGRTLKGECLSAPGGPDRPFSAAQVTEKAAQILHPAYPGALAPLAAATRLEPGALDATWRDIVAGFA
jgi:2-methylcitrate dehydratase PrpD